jgi:predicted Rossmann fold nucleotide-binding protein DprA/Smf involved in DNA uptake
MQPHEYLGDDGQVLLALCSTFALPEKAAAAGLSPFTLSEWNQLEGRIQRSVLQRPAALQGRTAEEIARELGLPGEDVERILRLLERSGGLGLQLEGLFSRGMWVVARLDEQYPARLRNVLKHQAPTVLFGAGDIELLKRPGVAVVGSRSIDEAGAAFAREVGSKTAAAKLAVVSGGARGTDRLAMEGALAADGVAVGALADSLEATIRKSDVRDFLLEGRLALLTPYAPTAGFSVGAAMGRNKVIYGLAKFAVVVSSDFQSGGTWAGAVEALKGRWCPVFVRDDASVPKGNRELLKLGGVALPQGDLDKMENLEEWMRSHTQAKWAEQDLFARE